MFDSHNSNDSQSSQSQYMLDLQRLKERKEALLKSKGFSTSNQSVSEHSSNFNFTQK